MTENAPARAAGENRTGSRPNLAAAGRTPPDRHQDTPEGAGADSGPIPSRPAAVVGRVLIERFGDGPLREVLVVAQEPTTAEETTMPNPTHTLHALAAECSDHALAWDQRHDPDGHAAAWDALHTLLTAAGAWVEHLIKIRPDLAPAAVDDIVTAVRRLATHLTVAEEADDA